MKVFISSTIALAALAAAPAQAELPSTVKVLMNEDVNPCDDFYQYACGNWLKATEIPATDVSVDYSFTSVSDRNEKVIQEIVQENWPLVGELWDSCVSMDKINAMGNKPLQKDLNRLSMLSSRSDVLKMLGEVARTGVPALAEFSVNADSKDAKTNALYMAYADMTLPNFGYYSNDSFPVVEKEYREYISTLFKLSGYGGSGSQQQGQQGSTGVSPTYFEDTIIKIEQTVVGLINDIQEQPEYYFPMTIGEAQTKFPLSFGAMSSGLGLLTKTTLTKESRVIFYITDYFENLEKYLASLDVKDLKTYVAFVYFHSKVRLLGDPWLEAYFKLFGKKLNGQQARAAREVSCVYRQLDYFPDLIGKYYYLKKFSPELESNTKLMIKLIEEAMGEHIKALDWLDEPTRAEAAGKLAKVANLIGQSTVKKSYPYTLSREDYFGNVNTILSDSFDNKLRKINKPVNRLEWSISPATVNAYYSPLENKMVFPAAILQPPFFNGTSHPAQNFGAIGAVIGHELTHGFDNSGARFDGDGNRRNWWTAKTAKAFEARGKCMSDQYSSFVVKAEDGSELAKVNGKTTLGENIADNGGFSLAWDAYHKYIKNGGIVGSSSVTPEEGEKLMFISFAQTWCGKSRDGAMLQQLDSDPHSPGEWRANGVAMNSEHFAGVFGCKKDVPYPMNPKNKCKLW